MAEPEAIAKASLSEGGAPKGRRESIKSVAAGDTSAVRCSLVYYRSLDRRTQVGKQILFYFDNHLSLCYDIRKNTLSSTEGHKGER